MLKIRIARESKTMAQLFLLGVLFVFAVTVGIGILSKNPTPESATAEEIRQQAVRVQELDARAARASEELGVSVTPEDLTPPAPVEQPRR